MGVAASGRLLDVRGGQASSSASNYTANSASSPWYDKSGNARDGTLTNFNATSSSGWTGAGTAGNPYCLTADGTNDYVDFGNLSAFNLAASAFTAEVWVKTTSSTAFVGFFDKISSSVGWCLQWGSGGNVGKPRLTINSSNIDASTAVNDGNWHHIVATYDGSSACQVIVDNGTPATGTASAGGTSSDPLKLFGDGASTNYLVGSIAAARLYNRVLSASEITGNYNAGPHATGADFTGTSAEAWAWSETAAPSSQSVGTSEAWAWSEGATDPPATPTLGVVTSDCHGRATMVATKGAGGGNPSSMKVYRGNTGFAEITSNCLITNNGDGTWTILDKRPAYGSEPIALGASGYYLVTATNSSGDSAASNTRSFTSNIDAATVELGFWDAIHNALGTTMSVTSGFTFPASTINVNAISGMNMTSGLAVIEEGATTSTFSFTGVTGTSFTGVTGGSGTFTTAARIKVYKDSNHLSYAYPGRYLLSAAYIAATYSTKTTEALTDLQAWWTFTKTQIDANGLFHANAYPTYTYTAHQFELLIYCCAASRLLRTRLAGNATAVALGNDMIAVMNTLGKACIDRLARQTLGVNGAGAQDATPATATAWASSTTYAAGVIRKPTVANGRVYRMVASTSQTSGSSEPTWPTTTSGVVNDGGCAWQECTNDLPDWQASHTYTLGQVRRPTTKNALAYRVTQAGTSASSEPTWPARGGTVSDGSVVWTESSVDGTSAFYAVSYNPTSPYAAVTGASQIGDEMARVAAGFAALLTDSAATDFYTGGSYRSAANTLALNHVRLGDTLQLGTGALEQQALWPAQDTPYGSYTAHVTSIALFLMGDSWSPHLAGWVDRTLDWLDTSWSTEPDIGSGVYTKFPSVGVSQVETNWRRAAYIVRGRSNPLPLVVYSSAYYYNYAQAGYSYQGGLNGSITFDNLDFLATIGVAVGYDLPTDLVTGEAWAWSEAATNVPTLPGRQADELWTWSETPTRVTSTATAKSASEAWGWTDTAGAPGVGVLYTRPFLAPLTVGPCYAPLDVGPALAPLDMEVQVI